MLSVTQAQQPGVDLLGLARHDERMIARLTPNNFALGFLDGTFGDPYPKLRTILKSGKITTLRVHLIDATCIRNNVCDPGSPGYDDRNALIKRINKLKSFMAEFPNVTVYVSPYLEHDEKRSNKVKRWFSDIKRIYPDSIPVCSAFTGYCPRYVLREKHGCGASSAPIISPDGDSGFDCNNFIFSRRAQVVHFNWIPENNGRATGDDTFTSPKLRTYFTTRDLYYQQILIASRVPRREEYPQIRECPLVHAPSIFKTNAEKYNNSNDTRGNRALYITLHRTKGFDITTLSGVKIGYMGYYGTYKGGGFRYYIGGGYGSGQNPVQLYEQLGGEWGLIKSGNYCRVFNAIRRMGVYRK